MPRRSRQNEFPTLPLQLALAAALIAVPGLLTAQQKTQPPQPASPRTPATRGGAGGFKINVNVNLVVLHATVLDHHGRMVNDLGEKNFRVSENGVPQKLSFFSHADVPVTMGIVIDDSGSMREKRPAVNAAALTFVKTSNPADQVFVVNFNDVYYLDTPGNFAANMEELKAALGKIDSRGGTALYDAIYASLDHLKLGNRDKKVLLVITDGEDNASRYTLSDLARYAENSNAVIYTIGLLEGEQPSGGLFSFHRAGSGRAAKVLKEIAQSTGGQAYFPKTLDEVESICVKIAHDIRNQYTLAYYPTDAKKDGTFRNVRVELVGEAAKHDTVRTRPGYYAPKPAESASVASSQ
jgi:Ca-activated chloride channel homolog